ncbi:MAG: BLUF domain-containing protein [Alphaproteobacteria bacterium]|nr:BLUF domain-containing protein [Alphaproteobacteria bacterium]
MAAGSHEEQATAGPAQDERLGYCLYRSMARPGLDRGEIDQILEKARRSNRMLSLTGCLHYENGMFFQWLEGPRLRLFRLLDALHQDDRHLNMTVLDQGSLEKRLFEGWEMRFSDRAAASLFDWLADWGSRADDVEAYAERVAVFLQSIRQDDRYRLGE